jgi:hypothetical protein
MDAINIYPELTYISPTRVFSWLPTAIKQSALKDSQLSLF